MLALLRVRVVAGMSGYACFIDACVVLNQQLAPNGWAVAAVTLLCRPRLPTVVAAVDAVGAVVLAGAAFKASDASSAVRIAADTHDDARDVAAAAATDADADNVAAAATDDDDGDVAAATATAAADDDDAAPPAAAAANTCAGGYAAAAATISFEFWKTPCARTLCLHHR